MNKKLKKELKEGLDELYSTLAKIIEDLDAVSD
jgi:hypothetical protein